MAALSTETRNSPVPDGYIPGSSAPSVPFTSIAAIEVVSKTVIPNTVSAVDPDLFNFIINLCTTKVPGWHSLTAADIHVEELCGGLTNKLYKACLKNETDDIQFPQVVIRFFGKDTNMFFERRAEFVVAQTLSDNRQGVRVFGTFNTFGGGRVEAFHKGRTLRCEDLSNPDISVRIARSMARLHTLDIPLDRDPLLPKNLVRWLSIAKTLNVPFVTSSRSKTVFSIRAIEEQVNWLNQTLPKVGSPILFCHNDLQEGNVIYDDNRKIVQVIDYEYSGYNYRGFDLANHFCEHYINYNVSHPPFFSLDTATYPSKEHQIRFLNAYLEAYNEERQRQREHGAVDDENNPVPDSDDTVEQLYKEGQYFMMASNLMWGIWSIIQAVKSDIAFGYMEYAHARFSDYFRQKEKVLAELPLKKE